MTTLRVIGTRTPRKEGGQKVQGQSKFAGDFTLPGVLWGKTLRSPYPHARILSMDASKARQLPGVAAVITGLDIPAHQLVGRRVRDQHLLARERVRFVGERVAVVAAADPNVAEEALSLIEVEYEELPAVFDSLEAVKPDAPRLHDDPRAYPGANPAEGAPDYPNICSYNRWAEGDLDYAFAKADRVFEGVYHTPLEHHGYIEPNACLVSVDPVSWHADVWTSVKAPVPMRKNAAEALEVGQSTITLHPLAIGGDFGGKGHPLDVTSAYLLSKETGHPVKMVMSYTEDLMAANARHPSTIFVKSAVSKEGMLLGMRVEAYFNSGGYGGFKPIPTVQVHGIHQAASCYRVPAIDVQSFVIYTNTVPSGHMRAPGAPQTSLAIEAHLDEIANALAIDRGEFRLQNVLKEGDPNPMGELWKDNRAKETLAKAMDAAGWNDAKAPYVGRGIGMYERSAGGGDANVKISVNAKGNVSIITPAPDPGQGGYTVMAQIASEKLGVPIEDISIQTITTDNFESDSGVGGSRVTYVGGQAAFQGCERVQEQMLHVAAERFGENVDALRWENGSVVGGKRVVSFQEMASVAVETLGGPVESAIRFVGEAQEVTSFAAQVAEVEVDPETGQVTLRRLTTSHDIGTIVNPVAHQSQIEGGAIQGIGFGLMEEHVLDDGRPIALHLGDYKIPNIQDIPNLTTVLLEPAEGPAPYNAKAIGEHSNVPTAGAIANAVADAIGMPVKEIPVTAERIYNLLKKKPNAR
jgi:CO/xanthine dehydrogenase Mo-binding subunit